VSAAPSLPNFNSEDEDDDLSYFARLAEEDWNQNHLLKSNGALQKRPIFLSKTKC
jgi:hypothetical protein